MVRAKLWVFWFFEEDVEKKHWFEMDKDMKVCFSVDFEFGVFKIRLQ